MALKILEKVVSFHFSSICILRVEYVQKKRWIRMSTTVANTQYNKKGFVLFVSNV